MTLPDILLPLFSQTPCGPAQDQPLFLPLAGKTTLGTVFGKCFCLFSDEHSFFVQNTLSFLCSSIDIFVVIVIFH